MNGNLTAHNKTKKQKKRKTKQKTKKSEKQNKKQKIIKQNKKHCTYFFYVIFSLCPRIFNNPNLKP